MLLISHFINEELLLPYWLKHHLPIFDHAVLIDYGSTDNSLDIIRQLAPHWEVRRTTVSEFKEPFIGDEVQAIEEEFGETWKVALNVTEFLLCDDVRRFLQRFEQEFPGVPGLRTQGVIMVDQADEKPLTTEPLVLQRRWGLVESPRQQIPIYGLSGRTPLRCRFFHKLARGHYLNGRHTTMVQPLLKPIDAKFGIGTLGRELTDGLPDWIRNSWQGVHPEIFTCWFGRYSPFEAIKKRIAAFDFALQRPSFFNGCMPTTPNDCSLLEEEVVELRKMAQDLWGVEAYSHCLGGV